MNKHEQFAPVDRLLSVPEAAARLGISVVPVYHWAWSGLLPSVKLGRRRLFLSGDLDAFIARARTSFKEELEQ